MLRYCNPARRGFALDQIGALNCSTQFAFVRIRFYALVYQIIPLGGIQVLRHQGGGWVGSKNGNS